ncbi:uncharacterized protein LOC115305095 [Suricata suricatta]|uniref:uncharacterized protein LOC115305095 n=1 Tax=Suricata suricatta TaxID=37032 RepID=UPI001156049E|nr:uncharacterized protein LOC115305095 [Suricata suricatta]
MAMLLNHTLRPRLGRYSESKLLKHKGSMVPSYAVLLETVWTALAATMSHWDVGDMDQREGKQLVPSMTVAAEMPKLLTSLGHMNWAISKARCGVLTVQHEDLTMSVCLAAQIFFRGLCRLSLPGIPTSVLLTSSVSSLPQPSHETITKAAPGNRYSRGSPGGAPWRTLPPSAFRVQSRPHQFHSHVTCLCVHLGVSICSAHRDACNSKCFPAMMEKMRHYQD